MSQPLDDELAATMRTIRALQARSPDELEDYFHLLIVRVLNKGRQLSNWLGYIYKGVKARIACGQEVDYYYPIYEDMVSDERIIDTDLRLDVRAALRQLPTQRRAFIHEYFFQGLTLEEIAHQHQVTNQYVSKSIRRGLQTMKVYLQDGYE